VFIAEAEETSNELHYDSVYTHDICTLLAGKVEIERFLEHLHSG
jgi:hypothetical protein